MKALAILLMSAVPATASVPENAPDTEMQLVPQAVAMRQAPEANCGKAQEMIIVVRDENGSVVAMGKALVAPAC